MAWVLSFIAVVALMVCMKVNQVRRKRKQLNAAMKRQGVPVVEGGDWLTGQGLTLVAMRRRMQQPDFSAFNPNKPHDIESSVNPFYAHQRKIYGKTFLYWLGAEPGLHCMNPEVVKTVLLTQSKSFQRQFKAKRLLGEIAGFDNIAGTEGALSHQKRGVISPYFHLERVKGMFSTVMSGISPIVERLESLVNEGGGQAEIAVESLMSEMSGDVICRSAFGSTYQIGKKFYDKVDQIAVQAYNNYIMHATIPGYRFLPTSGQRSNWKLKREATEIISGIVSARKAAAMEGKVAAEDRKDLLAIMLSSNLNAVDESKMLMVAGSESTGRFLTWTTMLMAMYPAWQEKAYAEVREHCGDETPTVDAISNYKIIPLILMEVLRLYPPVANLSREAKQDVKVGENMVIPKGVNVFMNIVALHHDTDLWGSDAGQFRPDRFAQGLSKACKHPMAYIPFGGGPRLCIGQNLSMTEAKVLLSLTLQRFSLSLPPHFRCEATLGITIHPRYAVPIIFTRRPSISDTGLSR